MGKVAVEPLVQSLHPKQIRGGMCGSGGTFALPADCRCVVAAGGDGAFADVVVVDEDVMMHYGS